MLVSTVLEGKGSGVHTIDPEATISAAIGRLAELSVGALVVSRNGRTLDGILSERDIVRGLGEEGARLLDARVSEVMTVRVLTCRRGDRVADVMGAMTSHRIRHVPVVENGMLAGMISIGDVVKSRLDEITQEAEALRDYIAHA